MGPLTGWLNPSELRIGLGCMRLADGGAATIAAAATAGITVFDTARAYGENERLLGQALRECGADGRARIVTKGGMVRPGGAWVPDGRAKAVRADCEASLAALDGLAVDLYLLHVPDPRTPWPTSVRALARLVDEGLVRRVGIANVNRRQLDEAMELAPVAAVQVALSPFDDRALRGGVVERCEQLGLALIAHSPLGGPKRARGIARRPGIAELATAHGVTAAEAALAWLLDLSPVVVPIPGATTPETAGSAARAATLSLGAGRRARRPMASMRTDADVVLVMGIPGAGKSRVAAEYAQRGYLRLNRDERGGSLRRLAETLEEQLDAGTRRVVLDNTYLTRASRHDVIEAAGRRGAAVSCIWLDTPLAQAQANMVERLLDRFDGALPVPQELRELSRREPWLLAPTSQMRAARELEPPAADDGFAGVEQVPFARAPGGGRPGVFVAAAAAGHAAETPDAPHLVFDWNPDGDAAALDAAADRLAALVRGPVERALCPHPAGPPTCWCRPPLPGLPLAFARAHGVDAARSLVVGTRPAHRTLAATLGARYAEPGST